MSDSAFNEVIRAVEKGEVMSITQEGETVAILIQPDLLARLRQEVVDKSSEDAVEHRNIFDPEKE